MFEKVGTGTINKILLILAVLLIAEIILFDGGLLFSLLFSGLLIYFGHRSYHRTFGKVIFWVGLVSLILTVLSMAVVRFLLFLLLVLFLYSYFQSGRQTVHPDFSVEAAIPQKEPVIRQKMWGDQTTPEAYAWNDINVHGGIGDRTIDLSNTVLPEKAVISIRHLAGTVTIYIPYETEVLVHHSALIGRATIFDYRSTNLWNNTVHYQTEGYGWKEPGVRIITSVLSGDLEVKRI